MIVPDRCVILPQQGHHVFRIRTLGEAGEAAQIAVERGNLAAVAFQLPLRSRRNNEIGDLRRQEAAQSAHAFDLADLLVHALFKSLVQLQQFRRLLLELGRLLLDHAEQARVLDRNDGLRGKVRHPRSICLSAKGRTS